MAAGPLGPAAELAFQHQPAIALDRLGCVVAVGAAAEALLDDELRVVGRRLVPRDRRAASDLASVVEQLAMPPPPRPARSSSAAREDGRC
jgi:hypothetical protein